MKNLSIKPAQSLLVCYRSQLGFALTTGVFNPTGSATGSPSIGVFEAAGVFCNRQLWTENCRSVGGSFIDLQTLHCTMAALLECGGLPVKKKQNCTRKGRVFPLLLVS
jgi:hypothetical protein